MNFILILSPQRIILGGVGFTVARQERRRMEGLAIPEALRGKYPEEDLLTNEIILLLAKD